MHPAKSEVAKMPFREDNLQKNLLPESFRKTLFFGNFPEEPSSGRRFRDSGRIQEHFPEERHPECFRKKGLPEIYFFKK